MEFLKYHIALIILSLCILACETGEPEPEPPDWEETAYYYDQGFNTNDLQEKLKYYNTGLSKINDRRDTSLLGMLDGKVLIYHEFKQYDSAYSYTDSLWKAASFQRDTFYMARVFYRRARIENVKNNPIGFFENTYKARELLLKSGQRSVAARRSIDMANVQFDMGDFAGAQASAIEALRFIKVERAMDSIFLSSAYNVIGLSYFSRDLNHEAIKEYQNAIKFAVRAQDSLIFLHNIALAHKNEEKYETAIEIFEQLAPSEVPSATSKQRILDNLYYTKWLHRPQSVKAANFLEVLEERRKLQDFEGMFDSHMHLSNFYEQQNLVQAKAHANKALETARIIKSPILEHSALQKLLRLQTKDAEADHIMRFITLNDSLQKARLQANYQFAKIRFDKEQDEQQIALLETQNFVQALEAEKLRSRHMVSTLTGIFILIFAIVIFYFFKQRSKREKIREIYLTESRISKRIHDELANDVYNLMSSLEKQQSVELLDKLENIYNRTRDISRENSEIETGKQFIDDLVTNLTTNTGDAKIILTGENTIAWEQVADEVKIVIYRVLQELMINMKKHSAASLVAISFKKNRNTIEIKYSDNGKGCAPADFYKGSGMRNIKRRIASIDGEIKWDIAEGKGCKAYIKI